MLEFPALIVFAESLLVAFLFGSNQSLVRRVELLEQAIKHFVPEHQVDLLERRLNAVEGEREAVDTALRSLAKGLADTYGKVDEVKANGDETFFRKDNAG